MAIPVEMTDIDLAERATTIGCWLVPVGAQVVQGDRLLELLAGEVVVDLPAPATGKLAEKRVADGDVVTRGQVLGTIETSDNRESRHGPRGQ